MCSLPSFPHALIRDIISNSEVSRAWRALRQGSFQKDMQIAKMDCD